MLGKACINELKPVTSSGTRPAAAMSVSINPSSSSFEVPAVKLTPRPFLTENFNIWSASINSGAVLLRLAVSVSALEENTRSHGTAEPWIGRMSTASAKMVGYRS